MQEKTRSTPNYRERAAKLREIAMKELSGDHQKLILTVSSEYELVARVLEMGSLPLAAD